MYLLLCVSTTLCVYITFTLLSSLWLAVIRTHRDEHGSAELGQLGRVALAVTVRGECIPLHGCATPERERDLY